MLTECIRGLANDKSLQGMRCLVWQILLES